MRRGALLRVTREPGESIIALVGFLAGGGHGCDEALYLGSLAGLGNGSPPPNLLSSYGKNDSDVSNLAPVISDGKSMKSECQPEGKSMEREWQPEGKSMEREWQPEGKSMKGKCHGEETR